MGLDVSHNCWSAPCSTFNEWRCEIARAVGWEVEDLGFTSVPKIDWTRYPERVAYGRWGGRKIEDSLVILFAHSDCEGIIRADHASLLADRLDEVVDLLPESMLEWDEKSPWTILHGNDWRGMTEKFIRGLRLAASRGEDVEFL